MRYRPLGDSGLTVSVVGLGCNNLGGRLDADATRAVVGAALDAGITLFDTADSYGADRDGSSEVLLGEALGRRRDDVVVATKFGSRVDGRNGPDWGRRGARRYVVRAVEASLQRLGTDRIDLYQHHHPDPTTPVEETLAALDDLVHAGKVLYVGTSNLAAWQAVDADWTARTRGLARPVSAQNHYSLLEREAERELVPALLRCGVGLLPYYPLANGLLTGKYRRDAPPPPGTRLSGREAELTAAVFDRVEALAAYAEERGRSLLDVAVGGLAAQPAVASVIAGATTADQVRANAAAGAWEPSADDLAVLDTIVPTPRRREA